MHPPPSDARLSKYRLDRLLGAGGMGSVYLARDLALDRDVAIKFLAPELAGDDVARRRFVREARAAAALDHSNICAVHEVILTDDGRACIVMQYVQGETLAEALGRGPLDVRDALTLASELTAALAAAHKRGIIHRDLKPQNVMITPSRHLKLVDFGIARVLESRKADDQPTLTSLSERGVIAGTPAYMSPEQIRQQPLDVRSDLFSFGAVLFEALTGHRAFKGPTLADIYAQILHEHPPAPSSLRPELTAQHDELCRRLLAKHPEDRFGSAEELAGALRVLSPDTAHASRHPSGTGPAAARPGLRRPAARVLPIAASIVIIAAIGVWKWNGPDRLPEPPPVAEEWFNRGVQKIRDGSYHGGVLALTTAIREFDAYPAAYARLAEAHSELDEGHAAQRALLQVTNLVPDLSRVPADDRLRLDAIRLLVTRDVASAVEAYRQLATRYPRDAGAWVDLGRAHEAAGNIAQARASYEQALTIDPTSAAAHLRHALILKEEGRRHEALEAFARADSLYGDDSNVEGQAETLLRRGAYLNAIGELPEARKTLERAGALATALDSRSQEIRVQLELASLTASEGRFTEATELAARAVQRAQDAGLDIVAAEGLSDLATAMMLNRRFREAETQIVRGIEIAKTRGAQRTVIRATLIHASIVLQLGRPGEVLRMIEEVSEPVRTGNYRRYGVTTDLLASRAHEGLDNLDEARQMAGRALTAAEHMKDDAQAAQAIESLAGLAVATGALPEALAFRLRAEQMHRRQGDIASLPYDLTNRAELLARMGRYEESEAVLREVDAGIADGIEPYVERTRRVRLVRAMNAAFLENRDAAARHARAAIENVKDAPEDGTARLGRALLQYAEATMDRRPSPGSHAPPTWQPSGEILYWRLMARLASADSRGALDDVLEALTSRTALSSNEFEWRLAALGAAAARRANSPADAERLRERGRKAFEELRRSWGEAVGPYESRADVAWLLREARIEPQD